LRSKIHKVLKNLNTSYKEILGCNKDFLIKWLEYRFDNNMTWENYGIYWDIDHIIPISNFDFSDEKQIKICFHWTNLQPLNKKINQSKSNKIIKKYIDDNIINITKFQSGYQILSETLEWLEKTRYGKNPVDIMDNSQLNIIKYLVQRLYGFA
jgi:hypothetical protein